MKIVCREPSVPGAAGPGFILLALITLLLLPALARGQSLVGPEHPQPPPPGAFEVRCLNPGEDPGRPCAPQAPPKDLRSADANLRNAGRQLASRPAPGSHQNLPVEPAASGWLPSWGPLPPVSVFCLQTNFRKYLETWPTPGSTATRDWPEYIPDDEENLD
jgi:hypothetical protein